MIPVRFTCPCCGQVEVQANQTAVVDFALKRSLTVHCPSCGELLIVSCSLMDYLRLRDHGAAWTDERAEVSK